MIESLKQIVSRKSSTFQNICALREELQILTLKAIYNDKYFNNIAFLGGTALRIIHKINRYSEDLDFSLINGNGYDFIKLNKTIVDFFASNNIKVESKPDASKTVHSTFLKFGDVLQNTGLPVPKTQKLSIKFEVDSNPPAGATTEYLQFSGKHTFRLSVSDLPSMFAGKLHACHCRKYTKGRDFYDLMWYLGKKILPNFNLLNNAILQTQNISLNINKDNLNNFIQNIVDKANFESIRKDVKPFLFNINEAEMLNKTAFDSLLKYYNR